MLRRLAVWIALGWGLARPAAAAQRVAVVVAVSEVSSLPPELELKSARDDARNLSRYLEDHGGYEKVYTLMDGVATRSAVVQLLTQTIPAELAPGDTLLVVFVGHGIGGDFGDPYLLLSDSLIPEAATSALKLYEFSQDLARRLDGVNLIFITDAAHAGSASGVELLGPSAKSFPSLPGNVFLLSAAGPQETAPEGLFVPLLVEGLSGSADSNGDGAVTASELHRYLLVRAAVVSGDKVHPAEAGSYDPGLVVALASPRGGPEVDRRDRPTLRFGGPVSYSMMGAGVALMGSSALYGQVRGHKLCEFGGPDGPECTSDQAERYLSVRALTYAGYLTGALISATGVGLGFVPLDGGAWVGIRFRR